MDFPNGAIRELIDLIEGRKQLTPQQIADTEALHQAFLVRKAELDAIVLARQQEQHVS